MDQTKEAPAELKLRLGAISPTIARQLKAQGLKARKADVERWQGLSDAISILGVHGYLGADAAHKARTRLFKEVRGGVSR